MTDQPDQQPLPPEQNLSPLAAPTGADVRRVNRLLDRLTVERRHQGGSFNSSV